MSVLRRMEVEARPLPILARLACAATTLEVLYTVLAGGAKVMRLVIANRANATKAFRVAISPLGVADDPEHYLYYDAPIAANETLTLDINAELIEDDEVRFYGSSADLTATLFGTTP